MEINRVNFMEAQGVRNRLPAIQYLSVHCDIFPLVLSSGSEEVSLSGNEGSNLSRRPFLEQVVDLLLCTLFDSEYVFLFLCHIFTQRPMNDRETKQWARLWSATTWTYSQFHQKFHFTWEKKLTRRGPIFTKHENLFDSWIESVSLEW